MLLSGSWWSLPASHYLERYVLPFSYRSCGSQNMSNMYRATTISAQRCRMVGSRNTKSPALPSFTLGIQLAYILSMLDHRYNLGLYALLLSSHLWLLLALSMCRSSLYVVSALVVDICNVLLHPVSQRPKLRRRRTCMSSLLISLYPCLSRTWSIVWKLCSKTIENYNGCFLPDLVGLVPRWSSSTSESERIERSSQLLTSLQIAHHLFPRCPRPLLREVSKRVQDWAAKTEWVKSDLIFPLRLMSLRRGVTFESRGFVSSNFKIRNMLSDVRSISLSTPGMADYSFVDCTTSSGSAWCCFANQRWHATHGLKRCGSPSAAATIILGIFREELKQDWAMEG